MVKRNLILVGVLAVLTSPFGLAQEKKIEISPIIGYTFSEGVSVDPVEINGNIINDVNPTSGLSYGFVMDYLATENVALGFLFSNQDSKLEAGYRGGSKEELTNLAVRNYHGILTYTMGEGDTKVRPFLFGGLGATQFSFDEIQSNEVDGETRFSATWGGGVKVFASENVGLRLMGRWTPTYIKSDPEGIWCSPWYPWGCWVVGDPQYAQQFEMSAGVTFAF